MTNRRHFLTGGAGAAAAASLWASAANAQGNRAASPATAYKAGSAERSLDIINLYDLEKEAEKLIPKPQFGYISSGSGDEWTLRENIRAFDDVEIIPEYLVGIDQPDTSTILLGSKVGLPVFIPPMAAHGLAHSSAEKGTAKGLRMPGRCLPPRPSLM